MIDVRLVTDAIEAAPLIAGVAAADCGAVSLFLGIVREENDGRAVTGIDYSAYEKMALKEMRDIASEAARRFVVSRITLVHRLGTLAVGDVSIGIAVAHPHRAPAIAATGYIIEEVKKRVPIWKRERYVDGTREWVDPARVNAEATR
jgi:molybdopterin synthase catalytic subunit